MSRVEIIGDATVYLGDCREIVPALGGFDLVVTDPPYLLTSGGQTDSHKSLGGWLGAYSNDGRPVTCDITWPEIMAIAYRALKDDGDAYVMANDKNVNLAWCAALQSGFDFHNLLVWDKRSAVMNRWYMKNCEFCLYLWKGRAKAIRDPSSTQLLTVPNLRNNDHRTAKPVELMAHYILNSSDIGDAVLDPFMGSGSTAVAAVRNKRRFTGIEIEQEHFDMACRRIEEATRQVEMFVGAQPTIQEEFEYDADKDMSASVAECYRAIKERVAKGGPPWVPPEVDKP